MFNRAIRLSPGIYVNEPGALKKLPELINEFTLKSPVILTDQTVLKIIPQYLPADFVTRYPVEIFNGSCEFAEIDRLTEQLKPYDGIIAFGGGQLMDTAKVVSDRLNNVLINVQTVPSNCAAFTTKSIVYSPTHEMIASVRKKKPVDAVILEPELLKNAPLEYLRSGIGDTLAKYYEIRRRLTDDKMHSLSLSLARDMIERCREEMLKVDNPRSLNGLNLQNFIDTIFLAASLVDGFADLDGRSVAAHTFYNAYVKIIGPQRFTHGEIVALGNLFQVTLENDAALIKEIRAYYPRVGLPLSLADLGITQAEQLDSLAEYMAKPDNVRMQSIFPKISAAAIRETLTKLV